MIADNCTIGNKYDFNSSKCVPCPSGYYQPQTGMIGCRECPQGSTTMGEGATSVNDCNVTCDPGSYMDDHDVCQRCANGTYRNNTMTGCGDCPRGLTTSTDGAQMITDCNVQYCPPGTRCVPNFDPSRYQSFADVCIPCVIGTYSDTYNRTECEQCPPATPITTGVGSTSVTQCIVGQVNLCAPEDAQSCASNDTCCNLVAIGYQCTLCNKPDSQQAPAESWYVWVAIIAGCVVFGIIVATLVIIFRIR